QYRTGQDIEKLDDKLQILGYTDEDIEKLKTVAKFIPNAQDVIRFGVREVYSPALWGSPPPTEEFDGVWNLAQKDVEAIGMNEEAFKKYWIAHWILPSVMQGFEMRHRDIIKDADLDRLFKMLDILPEWREPLKKISYVPFTRVDVRRMHKIGTLSDEDIKRAYKDIGYDEEKATKMMEFTILYNADPEEADKTDIDREITEMRSLSKSDVLRNYRLNIIDKST
ncbi:unnamed protein product, partial [marine sediment metagenome]